METAKAVTTIGARNESARRPDRKLEHDVRGDRRPADPARARPARAADHAAPGQRARSRSCRPRCARSTELVEASKPTTKPLTVLLERLRAGAQHGDAGGAQLQPRLQPPGSQQRPHRPRARRCPRSPRSLTTASPASVQALQGIGSDHGLLRAPTHPTSRARCARSARPPPTTTPTGTTPASARLPRLPPRRKQHAHAGEPQLAGARSLEDRPAAPLPGRRHAARRRRLLAVRRQRPARPATRCRRPDEPAPADISLAGSPLLIGAITTLIVVVAVFLSYNANNGLPFVPTYNLKVELPEASGLQKANQVRICGHAGGRGSASSQRTRTRGPGGSRRSRTLKLEKKVEPLPADTRAIVQSVSAIGLKYLELEKGTRCARSRPARRSRQPDDANR